MHWKNHKTIDSKREAPLLASNDKSFLIKATPITEGDSITKNKCGDSLWFKDGTLITGKVVRKNPFLVKIKTCTDTGIKITKVSRAELKKIKYEIKKPVKQVPSEHLARVAKTFALWFLICGILTGVSLLLPLYGLQVLPAAAGVVFYILTWISSLLALKNIKQNPEKHSGKKVAMDALLTVIICTFLLLIVSIVIAAVFFF